MNEKNTVSMKEQRLRRQRINRMKTAILATVGVWMCVSMAFCIVLSIQVFRLSRKVDEIADNAVLVQAMAEEMDEYRGSENNSNAQTMNVGDGSMELGSQALDPEGDSGLSGTDASPNGADASGDGTSSDGTGSSDAGTATDGAGASGDSASLGDMGSTDAGTVSDGAGASGDSAPPDGAGSADSGTVSDGAGASGDGTSSDGGAPPADPYADNPTNEPQEGERQKVYLTFDDGPSSNTAKILDILKEKGVKATFFVVGKEDEESKAMYRRIIEEGHTLGMHSYTHKYSVIYDSLESFQEDFERIRSYLTEITGVEPTIMRFPGGSSNKVSNLDMREFIRYINDQGITYYDWNVVSGDATSQVYTPEELVENVMKDVVKYDTSIVLMHDASTKGSTVEALDDIIDQLQAMDMELLPIDENTRPIQHITLEDALAYTE